MSINKLLPNFTIRVWIWLGILALIIFLYGFIREVGVGHPVLYFLLTFSLFFKLLRILFEWYHYAGVRQAPKLLSHASWKVDMLTTACPEEPREMIEETLRAMVNVKYPHQTYLCDEGNDPYYQKLCQKLGVHYVTRSTRVNAKAGNINNALKQANGDICVILDPDHVPTPDFLDQVLPHFEDPEIGYVQVVQAYKNQSDSLIARAAAEQTYIFYGPFMRGMSHYGTTQAIGANCTFRREALDSIGGHAPGLTEDMHTSMLLHAKGWKSVYIPKIVSHGLVPSSLSAYYKQQLKWTRGTFDLLLNVYPRLFGQFSWRQKLHYGILPLYYFLGVITLVDISLPIYSLLSEEYPWHMQPAKFFAYYTPLMIFLIGIRLYAQRWLYKPNERGLHLLGGILRVGTWWIYILGFVYTLLNIKVPYIPTPKEHDPKNEFLLGIPNLLVAFLSIGAAIFGLHLDWQPYSFIMAFFAISNGLVLLSAFIMGQNALLANFYHLWSSLKYRLSLIGLQLSYGRVNVVAIRGLYLGPFAAILIALSLSFQNSNEVIIAEDMDWPIEKEIGGFYTGIYMPVVDQTHSINNILKAEKQTQHSFSIISTYLAWGADSLPIKHWQTIIKKNAIPMITWEPWTNLFPQYADHPDLSQNRKVFHYILEGYFDAYIDHMATSLRSLGFPVFLRFAHEMDNPMYPWSSTGENTPEEFIAAWRYVHDRFEDLGVQNVTWVWNPWKSSAMEAYFPNGKNYPESRYVDWIGITCLNYGEANPDQKWYTFEDLYRPFQQKIDHLSIKLPVMLTEFGSVSYGGDATAWVRKALYSIQKGYPEIKSAVLFYSDQDKNWVTAWRPDDGKTCIDWTYDLSTLSSFLAIFNVPSLTSFTDKPSTTILKPLNTTLPIKGTFGNFSWQVEEAPFYFKGICYNPEHDWRDGFLPLTRKQLEHDFRQIKAMGANTIRRYEPGIYDKNIFNVAEEEGLYILYGFWFDPEIDYYHDTDAVAAYEDKVLKYVRKYKHRKCIIGWNIGNETWGLMKKHFTKPYLTLNRRAYLEFLERIAQKIHEIDPDRPVFASEEHEHYQLASTLYEMRTHTPSIDIIGINSYFEPNIQQLQKVFSQFDTLRPYVITEFGPKGYWSQEFGDFRNDRPIEVSSLSKARWYERQWNEYIERDKGYNLGGFAFSWRDRYEGTATWFGITDYKGRLKPTYYYLQKAWTSKNSIADSQFPALSIVGPWYPRKAGQTLWLSAGISNNYKGNLTYEWEVYEADTWKRSTPVKNTISNKQYVEIQMPERKSRYRVYVHATDSIGNVVTASRPLFFE